MQLHEKIAKETNKDINKLNGKIAKRVVKATKRSDQLKHRMARLHELWLEFIKCMAELQTGVEMLVTNKKKIAIEEKLNTDYAIREIEEIRDRLIGE